ncbi:MAG TPA: type II toxin-antitoxin system RelE/ParE family toxin [Acidobacteriaceae bacterium]|nr:type II toxin-antitoxin system RelE/ParE family toxin [Acidobacteriaceae bacterium]
MKVEFSDYVEDDLEAIADYIARDNPERALTFIREIRAEIRAIGRNPLLYRLRPEIGEDARMAFRGRYVILFRIADKRVRVERVVYGGRDLAPLLES